MTRDALSLRTPVGSLLEQVARDVVMPRFRTLAAHQIEEKSPGELVTEADRLAEEHLARGLLAIAPGTRVVGEEAVAKDESLLDGLGQGAVWIVDPIDGTAHFVAGRAPFGLMIGFAIDGLVQAAWIFDPLRPRMCFAARGGGAWIDDAPLVATDPGRSRPIASMGTHLMPVDEGAAFAARARRDFDLVPVPRCAAEHYPRVATGENDVALFRRTLVWDHAAGTLILNESGGRAARWDGSDFRVGDGGTGMLIATTPALWERAHAALLA